MSKFFYSLFILSALQLMRLDLLSQNVGIGTNNPQATLDVRGNLHVGGLTNYLSYDSLSGKIIWSNSNLFVTGSQYLMQHSASAEGLWYGNGKLLYKGINDTAFYTDWTNGNGYFKGNVGIGKSDPGVKLHVAGGSSGAIPFAFSHLVVEGNDHTYINLLSPNDKETAILFGKPDNAASGVIMYNNTSAPNGFQFRNNGNQTRMVIDNAGNVGIGTIFPHYPLDIYGRMRLSGTNPDDPGMWLNDAGADRAFIGLQNDSQVGFYGNEGIGWGLTMNVSTGALAINGNTGAAGQILQSNGAGAPPDWINPVGAAAYKTQYYQATVNSVTLTNTSISSTINVPVTVNVNSIITVSATVNVSTANYFGCDHGEIAVTFEPLGGGGLVAAAGKFQTVCGGTSNTITTGELPLLASNGSMKIFAPGTGVGAIVRFVKLNTGPDLGIGNFSPATIIVKVVPL